MAKDPIAHPVLESLRRLEGAAPQRPLGRGERVLIVSDLHLGNGGSRDDFRRNASLFEAALRRYYLPEGFLLVLNGDIEELQRFPLPEVRRAWRGMFELFGEFRRGAGLYKIYGNHDFALSLREDPFPAERLLEGLRLTRDGQSLFVFHGHQASLFQERFMSLSGLALRYVATPLGFRSYSTSHDSRKKFRVERRVYTFAAAAKTVALIGHTHRPLFESLSKIDVLRFRIEGLCREYAEARPRKREGLEEEIRRSKAELERLYEVKGEMPHTPSLYNSRFLVPCLFNSGCAVGKRGFTALEMRGGDIALVHWFDRRRSDRHLQPGAGVDSTGDPGDSEENPQQLGDSDYFRVVLNRDSLDYVFTRIRLLA
ncbi:MAG: metallophosphoesterase family protein [Spirochaetales bacterium]|nr:metallophosphoesterase family protein [Spirochaetales bacterium]